MALARYTYLAWLRRGAANSILEPANVKSRAEIAMRLAVSDGVTTGAPIEKRFKVNGPGDVIGIARDLVVRTEPRNWVTDFEPNYLAFIDFYDEDFCWRYTPAPADLARHRLTPWISLLVLAEGEFDRNLAPGRPLTSIVLKSSDVASFFPPVDAVDQADQAWAWAHVQIAGDIAGAAAPNQAHLRARLDASPDSGVSRLICPRRLEPNTAYYAFVVPTFEAGRKAGLGVAFDDEMEAGATLSWASGAGEFPVYYEWYFRTGEGGDFEDLVKRIQPCKADPRVGVRDMDIAAPGFGMPLVAEALGPGEPPSHHEGVVGLEGAAKAPTMQPKPLDQQSRFPVEAAKIVNAPADAQQSGDSDPVVAPPLMGGWHALLDRVDPAQRPAWTHDLNLDARQRAAGGLGARVVRKYQERYMKLAWEQVGEIIPANRKVGALRFSQAAMHSAFVKSVSPLPGARALALTAPIMLRVLVSPKTLRGLVSESRLPDASLSPAFRKLTRARGLAMRRALPAHQRRAAPARFAEALNEQRVSAAPAPAPVNGPTLDQIADVIDAGNRGKALLTRWMWWIIALLVVLGVAAFFLFSGAAGLAIAVASAVTAISVFVAAQNARQRLNAAAKLRLDALTPEAVPREAPAAFALSEPEAEAAPSPNAAEARDFGAALLTFAAFVAARPAPAPAPARARFDVANAQTKMMAAIAPAASYPRRAASLVRIGELSIIDYTREASGGGAAPPAPETPPDIKPAMAYPDIIEPMYRPLSEINDDLLLPNVGLIPPNSVTILLTNPPFIEAYMAGANHEFSRELLWREYPTDCRGTPFRQFWDVSRVPTPGTDGKARAALLKDIEEMHKWAKPNRLGQNPNSKRNLAGETVVLTLRGDLLKRYPNTIIYAQRARWSVKAGHENELELYDEVGAVALSGVNDPNIEYPVFSAPVAPDLTLVGFRLTLEEARGDPALEETKPARDSIAADKLGYFFVLQEALGEPRFGLDERIPPATMESEFKWDNLSWANLDMAGRKIVDLSRSFTVEPRGKPLDQLSAPPPTPVLNWRSANSNAADIAAILYQKPVMVAWHARQMIERGKV